MSTLLFTGPYEKFNMDFSSKEYHQKKRIQITINIENGTSDQTIVWKALAFFGKMEKNNTGKYESRTMSFPPEEE